MVSPVLLARCLPFSFVHTLSLLVSWTGFSLLGLLRSVSPSLCPCVQLCCGLSDKGKEAEGEMWGCCFLFHPPRNSSYVFYSLDQIQHQAVNRDRPESKPYSKNTESDFTGLKCSLYPTCCFKHRFFLPLSHNNI